jgi:putative membrane protein
MRAAVIASLISLMLLSAAHAQPPSGTLPKQPGEPQTVQGATDENFVVNTWLDGMAEVELGNLTQQRASNDQVKQFGQRMIADHTKANEELKPIAGRVNVTLPTSLDGMHAALKRTLQGLKGFEFDRRYMDEMVKNHRVAVSSFEQQAKTGNDGALKAFAQKTLPTLREHLKMAEDTLKAVEATATKKQ